jgi:hypothetical protein
MHVGCLWGTPGSAQRPPTVQVLQKTSRYADRPGLLL